MDHGDIYSEGLYNGFIEKLMRVRISKFEETDQMNSPYKST